MKCVNTVYVEPDGSHIMPTQTALFCTKSIQKNVLLITTTLYCV